MVRRTVLLSAACLSLLTSTFASAQEPPPPFNGVAERESRMYDDSWPDGNSYAWRDSISDDGRFVVTRWR